MRSYNFFAGAGPASSSPTTDTKLSPPASLQKSKSASHVPTMATTATAAPNGHVRTDTEFLNTLPDPRSPSPTLSRSPSSNDLSNEVSMLSTKLINAINHSTSLDDNLQHTRHDLEAAKKRVVQLESETKEHADAITSGVLLLKVDVDTNMAKLRAELAEARREREASDQAKKQMELEVENLTSALFEEANTVCQTADQIHVRVTTN